MHLQESAFFTARLARPLSRWCAGVAGVGILGIVILVALSSQVPASAGLHTAARAFAVVFGFFAAGLFVSFWRTFAHVADTAATTADRCDAMRRDPAVDLTEVFRVMQDYDAALASAPPIPEFVHRLRAARLTGAWERHISSSGSAAAAPTTQNRS